MNNITFLLPTRNTLPYTKMAYNSLRLHNPDAEIIILDDLSTDGTQSWLTTINHPNTVVWLNDPVNFKRTYPDQTFSGHTITYNIGATIAKNDIIGVFHSDMICTANYTNNLIKHLKPKSIISSTRIEPKIYPEDNAKILMDFGLYYNEFKENEFNQFVAKSEILFKDQTTKGFFAPFIMYTQEYLDLGGMDEGFAPFICEDSDFICRLYNEGYDIKQARDSFCYHWCSRGHRFTTGKVVFDTMEFKRIQARSLQYFINKWGTYPQNDSYSYPINVPKLPSP